MIHVVFALLLVCQAESFTLDGVTKNGDIVRFDGKVHDGFVIGHVTVGERRSPAFGVLVRDGRFYVEDQAGRQVDGDIDKGMIRLRE